MIRALLLACLTVILFCAAPAAASTNSAWSLRTWELNEGLPNNFVVGTAQAADGFIWVATRNGLTRFDGVRFQRFSITNFFTGTHGGPRALLGSADGGIWLALDPGYVFHMNSGRVQIFTNTSPELVTETMAEDRDGALWITCRGGVVCRIQDGKWTNLGVADGLPSGGSSMLARDATGRLWFAKGNQVGLLRGKRFRTLVHLDNATTRLCSSKAGGVWICSGPGLLRYDEGGTLQQIATYAADYPAIKPTVLLEDRSGAVWIGTSDSGLFHYDNHGCERVPTSDRQIRSIMEDRNGNIWIGTAAGGLNQVRPRTIQLEGTESGIPFEAAVQSLCEDTNGCLWAATQNGLLLRRTDTGWTAMTADTGWPGAGANCVIADPSGGLWVGTKEWALYRIGAGPPQRWGRADGLTGRWIDTILITHKGDVLISEEKPEAIHCLSGGRMKSLGLPRDARAFHCMAEDPAGNIWASANRAGGGRMLLRISGDQITDVTEHAAVLPRSIRCMHVTPDGSIWIGGNGENCLVRLKNGGFARIPSSEGLYDWVISQIVDDGRGWLWFGSDHGLFKVRQRELDDVADGVATHVQSVRYGPDEGLPGLQGNYGVSPGAVRSHDGKLWVPMRTALAVVSPDRQCEGLDPPPVFVQGVAVDGRTIAQYDSVVPLPNVVNLRGQSSGLRLPPDHRRIEFDFAALSYAAPENVQFRYRLEGLDDAWTDLGIQRTVGFSRLPAGSYRFEVRGCGSEGIWNETGASVGFVVLPFVWQTWWFRFTILAAFTLIVIAIVRYASFRRLQSRLLALERQAALDKERARIARDIHDDLGSRLTQITLLSEMAFRERAEPEATGAQIQQISATARQGIQALDETVWAVNPRNDTLSHLIDYIGRFAAELLHSAGLRYQIDLPDHPPSRIVPADVRHNLFLVVKEALNNAVRHAHATEVLLRVSVDDNSMDVSISDNGCGFERAPDDACADGLRNMRQRIEELGGHFRVESRPGAGARVFLHCPWKPEKGTTAGET